MFEETSFASPGGSSAGSTIDLAHERALQRWAEKSSASAQQVHAVIAAVGANASDVEAHLQETRATTNSERMNKAP